MNKERIAAYLAQNLLPSTVASIVGVSPSYISQLAKDESFKLLVEQKRAETEKTTTETELLDAKYLGLEHKLLSSIDAAMGMADLSDLTRTLDVVCKRQDQRAKQKLPVPTAQPAIYQNITNLILPAHAIPAQTSVPVAMNSESEVISINNQPLAPMSSVGVRSLFEKIQERKQAMGQTAAQAAHKQAQAEISKDF